MKKLESLEILFIRHAETQYDNIGDRDPSDGDLTPVGENQCLTLGERLRDLPIDAYFTSSLLRSFKTATGVCNAKDDKPLLEICPELVECGCTPGYYGCSEEYLKRFYPNAKMCDTKFYGTKEYDFPCKTIEDNDIRAKKVIDYIKSRFTYGQRVAVFSHHGMCEHLIPEALGIKSHQFSFALENTSVSAVGFFPDGNVILHYLNK